METEGPFPCSQEPTRIQRTCAAFFYGEELLASLRSWRITPCQLFETGLSKYNALYVWAHSKKLPLRVWGLVYEGSRIATQDPCRKSNWPVVWTVPAYANTVYLTIWKWLYVCMYVCMYIFVCVLCV